MRIKKGFVLREIAGQTMVIATGEASKSFHGMVTLNDTGRDIWLGLQDGLSENEIVDKLTSDYDISREQAAIDVKNLISKMNDAGFLTP